MNLRYIQMLRMLFLIHILTEVVIFLRLCYGPAVPPPNLSSYLEDQEVQALLVGLGHHPCQEALEALGHVKLRCLQVSSAARQGSIASLEGKKKKNFTCRMLRDNTSEKTGNKDGHKGTLKDPRYFLSDEHFDFLHKAEITLCVWRITQNSLQHINAIKRQQ